ncbi:MAG: hypothetical protein PHF84_10750, partial [bacterium]|nr:hypothetical protein [bacterium]
MGSGRRTAFIIFSTLDKKYHLLLDHLETNLDSNLWSGFLMKKGVPGDILLFLFFDDEQREQKNLARLIAHCRKEDYSF